MLWYFFAFQVAVMEMNDGNNVSKQPVSILCLKRNSRKSFKWKCYHCPKVFSQKLILEQRGKLLHKQRERGEGEFVDYCYFFFHFRYHLTPWRATSSTSRQRGACVPRARLWAWSGRCPICPRTAHPHVPWQKRSSSGGNSNRQDCGFFCAPL